MPGWIQIKTGLFCLALGLAALGAAPWCRAQALPANPLRTAGSLRLESSSEELMKGRWAELDVWRESAQAQQARPISVEEELPPPEPHSVVPQTFGPPGSPPGGTYGSWSDAGMHPWPAGAPAHEAVYGGHPHRWFTHHDPNDPYRHIGLGVPLEGTSWLNRPWFFGFFYGGLLADDLIAGQVESNNSFFIGFRVGWDFDHYWGAELRYAFSRPQIDDGAGNTLPEPSRDYFFDLSLAYYPWGDSRWRPYATIGLGFQTFRFHDASDEKIHESLLSLPIGVGVKYFYSPWFSLRLDAYDNIAFGAGRLDSMSNVTLALSVEFRWGDHPTNYFPWHGDTTHW
jgi:hypothetical protein